LRDERGIQRARNVNYITVPNSAALIPSRIRKNAGGGRRTRILANAATAESRTVNYITVPNSAALIRSRIRKNAGGGRRTRILTNAATAESGTHDPRLSKLRRFAKAMNLDIRKLL
jgi:hypothetical protein